MSIHAGCGPLAWSLYRLFPWDLVAAFVMIWSVWLLIVCFTPLRKLPYWLHLILGMIWCLNGCAPVSLTVT